jgi:hypothetical protein
MGQTMRDNPGDQPPPPRKAARPAVGPDAKEMEDGRYRAVLEYVLKTLEHHHMSRPGIPTLVKTARGLIN